VFRPVNPVGTKGSRYRGLTLASSRSVDRIVVWDRGGIEVGSASWIRVMMEREVEVGPERINLRSLLQGQTWQGEPPFLLHTCARAKVLIISDAVLSDLVLLRARGLVVLPCCSFFFFGWLTSVQL
jgi:hypothetical protein